MKLHSPIDLDPTDPRRFIIGERFRDGEPSGWYLREAVPIEMRSNRRNPYIFTSLKVSSEKEALQRVQDIRRGYPLGKTAGPIRRRNKICDLANAWLLTLDATKTHRIRRFRTCLEKHLLPKLGRLYLEEVDRGVINKWAESRALGELTKSTFEKDVHTLRSFFKWCDRKHNSRILELMPTDWGHLQFEAARVANRFPRVLADDIIQFAFDQTQSSNHPGHPRYWSSARLFGLITFMRYTGIRVQEYGQLRFRDVKIKLTTPDQRRSFVLRNKLHKSVSEALIDSETESDDAKYFAGFSVHVQGVKHPSHRRDVYPRVQFFDDWLWYIDLYRERCLGQSGFVPMSGSIDGIDGENVIFPNSTIDLKSGGRSISRPHSTLLRSYAQQVETSFGNLNQQSWRHTYATELVEDWINHGRSPDVAMLARNMGTSEAMVRKHYEKELDVFVPQGLSI